MNSLLEGLVARSDPTKRDTFEQMESSMTAVHNAALSAKQSSDKLDSFSGHGVRLHAQMHGDATVIGATGELDAFNIDHLIDYARRCLGGHRPLVLDLSQLDFLAAQGISVCLTSRTNAAGTESNGPWCPAMPSSVCCGSVNGARLPVVSSIDEAVQRFSAPCGRKGYCSSSRSRANVRASRRETCI